MAEVTCDLCGKTVSRRNSETYSWNGKRACMCHDCWGQFELWRYKTPQKAQARAHFENLAAGSSCSPAGLDFCNSVIMAEEQRNPSRQPGEQEPASPAGSSGASPASPGRAVLMFSLVGVIFLIAAIVFFANSIRETDIGTVANIQATVFAAMNFVAAVISFSAAGIVRALRKN